MIQILEFKDRYLEQAVKLFCAAYDQERKQSPLLPQHPFDREQRLKHNISELANRGGWVAIDNNDLVGYLLNGYRFTFKKRPAAMVPEIGHAVITPGKQEIYNLLYTAAAEKWAKDRVSLHLFGLLAHDRVLCDTIFELGFGFILTEGLRDLSLLEDVRGTADHIILVLFHYLNRLFKGIVETPAFYSKL